jgi:hypothetical protein
MSHITRAIIARRLAHRDILPRPAEAVDDERANQSLSLPRTVFSVWSAIPVR